MSQRFVHKDRSPQDNTSHACNHIFVKFLHPHICKRFVSIRDEHVMKFLRCQTVVLMDTLSIEIILRSRASSQNSPLLIDMKEVHF